MSVSQATTSVRLSCASLRTGRTPALARAAAPAEILRNDRRSMLTRASLVFDRFGGEEDGLGAVAIVLVQLADQLLPHRRRDVLLVLTHVADLNALDVAPRRPGGRVVDRPLDAERPVADDARQRLGHSIVVLAQPLFVRGWLHAGLQRVDHEADRHAISSRLLIGARARLEPWWAVIEGRGSAPPATGSKQSRRSPASRTRPVSTVAPLTATSHVSRSAPRSASSAPMVVPAASVLSRRSAPPGMNRRRLPCMCTVTVTREARAARGA